MQRIEFHTLQRMIPMKEHTIKGKEHKTKPQKALVFCLLLALCAAAAILAASATAILYGDTDGNGKIDGFDLVLLRRCLRDYDAETGTSSVRPGVYAARLRSPVAGCYGEDIPYGDANGDGKLGAADLALLRRYIAELDYCTGLSPVVLGPDCAHDYSVASDSSDCETDGIRTLICTRCGLKKDESVRAPGHDFVFAGTIAPTYAAGGYDEDVCTRCGKSVKSNFTDKLPSTIAGVPTQKYTIVYSSDVEGEEGSDMAAYVRRLMTANCGAAPTLCHDFRLGGANRIVVGPVLSSPTMAELYEGLTDPFDYKVAVRDGNVYIAGGGTYGLRAAAQLLAEKYLVNGSVPDGLVFSGNAYGRCLFPLTDGAEVRIMSNNVWNCDTDKWASPDEDCSAQGRYRGLCAVYLAYRPDVICFQEMTYVMINLIKNELNAHGLSYALLTYTTGTAKPYTCILYRSDRVRLIRQGHHDFTYGTDAGSKGYTWGYFQDLTTGKRFFALSTHMWWKGESDTPGSNAWREAQANEIVAATADLASLYGCPVFAMGDFNCNISSQAYKNFVAGGFADAFDLATVYADNIKGHHTCNADGYARESTTQSYSTAIDHIMLRNPVGTKILTFDHAHPYFFIKISDHYPLYVDAVIGND